jgi:hypothetical protein
MSEQLLNAHTNDELVFSSATHVAELVQVAWLPSQKLAQFLLYLNFLFCWVSFVCA